MNLKINDYIIGKTLGVGAFAKVKSKILIIEAKHQITEKEVAIKIVSKNKIKQGENL
jgi:5'-AMP-activated protein kinase catalytic alpha subunit